MWLVTFNGARDAYQVPLALAEADLLEQLVTDWYCPDMLARVASSRIAKRRGSGLSSRLVSWTPKAVLRHYIAQQLSMSSEERSASAREIQDILARRTLLKALRSDSDLLLYAGYATAAFSDKRLAHRKKVLFMYHPHNDLVCDLLARDHARHPEVSRSFELLRSDLEDRTVDTEIRNADHLVCASQFTSRTLQHMGVPQEDIHVVPYGIDVAGGSTQLPSSPDCHKSTFLFVGSGVQRKGLHILLRAWQRARLNSAKLTIVSRHIERGIADLLPIENVTVLSGVTDLELQNLYQRSDVFVMPSLVEGFGYVYLEALSRGCFVIGTENTGLPDLNCSEDCAAIAAAGEVESLISILIQADRLSKRGELDRTRIMSHCRSRSWHRFRERIRAVVSARN